MTNDGVWAGGDENVRVLDREGEGEEATQGVEAPEAEASAEEHECTAGEPG